MKTSEIKSMNDLKVGKRYLIDYEEHKGIAIFEKKFY